MIIKFMSIATGCIILNCVLIAFISVAMIKNNREKKHGKWILHDVYCEEQYECSNCHTKFVYDDNLGCDKWHYCPKCGAQMNID